MINLLPDDTKRDIRAARMNVVLLRYLFFTLSALVLLIVFCLLFYFILHNNESNAVTTNRDNTEKAKSYDDVRTAAEQYSTNLTLASQILGNGVSYTSVILGITQLLPKGVVLDGVTLTAADFGQQTSFVAHAKTYDDAAALKANFQTSKLFSNVYFESLTNGSDTPSAYPISVSISAKLNKVVN